MRLQKINYKKLNARQKESYNFQKISAVLADYGYTTIKLTDDWKNADFIAQNTDGNILKVQLKSRLIISNKYLKKRIYIAFREESDYYIYPHDKVFKKIVPNIKKTASWKNHKQYSFAKLSAINKILLSPYKI